MQRRQRGLRSCARQHSTVCTTAHLGEPAMPLLCKWGATLHGAKPPLGRSHTRALAAPRPHAPLKHACSAQAWRAGCCRARCCRASRPDWRVRLAQRAPHLHAAGRTVRMNARDDCHLRCAARRRGALRMRPQRRAAPDSDGRSSDALLSSGRYKAARGIIVRRVEASARTCDGTSAPGRTHHGAHAWTPLALDAPPRACAAN